MLSEGKNLDESALRSKMCENSARKYRDTGLLPSELKNEHGWRTRVDPFEDVWPEIARMLKGEPKLQALTLFSHLQRTYPGKFQDGQLRTLQRRVKRWRATEGPPKEVMFAQEHHPGRLSQSDFTHMGDLHITLEKQPFEHLLYHFTLTKSNWETGSICFSESFESLSEGMQRAFWELGGVTEYHQTDCLTTAVNKAGNPEVFTKRYTALMDHYRVKPKRINPGRANENGDVEQSHFRFKQAVDQELMLRGSRDFADRQEYEQFLRDIFAQRNRGRSEWVKIERTTLRRLPQKKLDSFKEQEKSVSRSSTINVDNNVYSVTSQLIGERVKVRVHADHLEVRYAQRFVEQIPRLRGEGKHRIQYRHIIDSLLRKPGAFENYKYKQDLFPTTRFRMVYDGLLKARTARGAAKEYLKILNLAAKERESLVDEAIRVLLHAGCQIIDSTMVEEAYRGLKSDHQPGKLEIHIEPADPASYDQLFDTKEATWIRLN